jgi:hypothetical protein
MRVVTVKVKGLQLVSGVWRSRKVLPPDAAAILGKAELTKTTGVAGEKGDLVALARAHEIAIREDHAGEFKRIIEEVRKSDANPLSKLEREIGDLRRFKLEEIADFLGERGYPNPFITKPLPKEPVTFEVLLATWELENTNERTRRTKRRYMARLAEHLGHPDATRVEPLGFSAFKEMLLKQANAGEIAYKSAENHMAGIKAVFNAAVKAHKIATNPCDGISFQAKRSQMAKTLGYSIGQVAVILREGRNQPSHIRYPTLIAGFSGARVGEIADATTHDIYMVGEMYVLDIRTDYRDERQAIKNEASIRKFPLHPQIIAEGFIEYWQSLPPGALFPAFSLGHDNRRGDAASREISEWIRDDLGVKDLSPKLRYKPNHSFRNYVKTQWRNAKIEEETHDAITGHGSSKDESRNYGEYELKLMLEAIEKLPNPLAERGADLAEAVAEDDRLGHFVE